MPVNPKRPCPDPMDDSMNESLNDSMNDSMEKRIKRISIEGNIGEMIFRTRSRFRSFILRCTRARCLFKARVFAKRLHAGL